MQFKRVLLIIAICLLTWGPASETSAGSSFYIYDELDRLNIALYPNGLIQYEYDEIGNLLKKSAVKSEANEFYIMVSGNSCGIVKPSGGIPVTSGGSLTLTFTANLAELIVDGVSVGIVRSYTFNNVTSPHSVSARFIARDGDVNGDGVLNNSDYLLALQIAAGIVPLTDFHVSHGDVGPVENGLLAPDGIFDLGDAIVINRLVSGDLKSSITCSADNFVSVNFSAGMGGTITGRTPQILAPNGSTSQVTAVPATGSQFVNWTGTGGFNTTTVNPLTVSNVTTSQKITANFAVNESFATAALPAGWSVQGTASISNMNHSAAYGLQLGDGINTDGSVSFVAPSTGELSFWYYKSGSWGYYWDLDPECYEVYGANAGSMTVSVNGSVVYTASSETGWVKTPVFNIHAGDTIRISQLGSSDDLGASCSDGCNVPYYNVSVYIDDVTIPGAAGDVTPPNTTVAPVGGTYSSAQTVTLSADEQAIIYYTTNATAPTINSAVYSAPLSIPATTTLKYFAKDPAGNSEIVKTQSYKIDTVLPVTSAVAGGGAYASAQTVTLSANELATIYYTTNGSTPTANSAVYSEPLTISTTTTLKYFARDTAGNSEEVKTESYSYTSDVEPPVTTATPGGGTYSYAQAVTLSANEQATIYYTTDGSTPNTNSAIYFTPLSISANTTLKYFAKDFAGNAEAVQSQTYTITSAPGATYNESFATTALPTGWSVQGTASIGNMNHSPAYGLQLGDGINIDGNVSFVAPASGGLSFWYYKLGNWGYYWEWDPECYEVYGANAGTMTVSVNGFVVYTASSDTGWVKTPVFSVQAGDTIKISQIGSSDDLGASCEDGCSQPYYNVFVHIDDVSIN